MVKYINDLIRISRFYGSRKDFVIAGGGNTSFKDKKFMWVKASGFSMADIDEHGFVQLYRDKVKETGKKKYSKDPHECEAEVKEDLLAARVYPEPGTRPSVETSLHEVIEYPFAVHTHPTLVNALMCSQQAQEKTTELFGEEALYIPYAPGYRLFKKITQALPVYRSRFGRDPHLIFLQNHGIFVSAGNTEEIKTLYRKVIETLYEIIRPDEIINIPLPGDTQILIDGLQKLFDGKIVKIRHNTLDRYFYSSREQFSLISRPFTPDIIVYCGPAYLYSDKKITASILSDLEQQWNAYLQKYKKQPKIILVKDFGLIAVEESTKSVETTLDVFEDFMKISKFSRSFGGPHPLPEDEIDFIDRWEVENYRRKIAKGE